MKGNCKQCNRPIEIDDDQETNRVCYNCKRMEHEIGLGLHLARLTPLPEAKLWEPSKPLAKLGDITITNYHRGYWVTEGKVPIEIARKLYEDPVGKMMIRVAGDCTCPSPEDHIHWFTPDNKVVLSMKEKAECDRLISSPSKLLAKVAQEALNDYLFSDTPQDIAEAYITSYHIDGDLGLRVFVDIIRAEMEQAHG